MSKLFDICPERYHNLFHTGRYTPNDSQCRPHHCRISITEFNGWSPQMSLYPQQVSILQRQNFPRSFALSSDLICAPSTASPHCVVTEVNSTKKPFTARCWMTERHVTTLLGCAGAGGDSVRWIHWISVLPTLRVATFDFFKKGIKLSPTDHR